MAVNKGEIGIYGVLRRDGGDGVLANADLIKDEAIGMTLALHNAWVNTEVSNKVNIEAGKGLSSNDFTDTYKNKLKYIETTQDNNLVLGTYSTNVRYLLKIGTDVTLTDNNDPYINIDSNSIYIGNKYIDTYIYSSNYKLSNEGLNGWNYKLNGDVLQLKLGTVVDVYDNNIYIGLYNNNTKLYGRNIYIGTTGRINLSESILMMSSSISMTSVDDISIQSQHITIGSDLDNEAIKLGISDRCLFISSSNGIELYGNTTIHTISKFNIRNGTGNIINNDGTSLILGNGFYTTVDLYMNLGGTGNVLLSSILQQKYDSTISRTQNTVLAAPTSANGTATFRKLELSDIPDLSSKYLVLDGNGYLTDARIAGLTAGYLNSNTGYIKASIPSNRSEKNSSSWYYATDGSLLDINKNVNKIKFYSTVGDLNIKISDLEYPGYVSLHTFDKSASNLPNTTSSNNNILINYYIGPFGETTLFSYLIVHNLNSSFIRICNSGKYTDWKQFAYTDSDITGNSATTTKLKTPVTIWGLSFDGSADVSGDIDLKTYRLKFGPSSSNPYQFISDSDNSLKLGKYGQADMITFARNGTYFGGDSIPTERVEVNGNVKSKEYLLSDGSKYAEQCLESDITALFN